MEFLQRLAQQLRELWQGMSTTRRIALVGVGISLVALIGAVGYFASQEEYRLLYYGLAPEDAGAITARLKAMNVNYKLSGNGTTISVPADQVQQMRLDLASEGLPGKPAKGFELFDEPSFGATPFTQHVQYLRALQGELART